MKYSLTVFRRKVFLCFNGGMCYVKMVHVTVEISDCARQTLVRARNASRC